MHPLSEPRPSESVKESVRRRKRLRHSFLNPCASAWGRRFRLPTRRSRRFFHGLSGSRCLRFFHRPVSCLALLLNGLLCAAQVNPDPASFRIAVDVNLVVLPIAVHDRQGRYVSGLQEQDFEVYEDRSAQRIRLFRHEDIPIIAGLLIDHSGSMRTKLAQVTAGARAFVQFSNPRDQMFVVNFNEKVSLGLPQGMPFSANVNELGWAIWKAPAQGETALYDAIIDSLQRLQTGSRDKKVLIVISDGADNASAHRLAQVLELAEQSGAIIYTVGLFEPGDQDANPKVLSHLAKATGGEAFFPHQLSAVVEICESIAHDIRDQYTIGYSSGAARNGAFRTVRVEARTPGQGKLVVRTRAGYIALAPTLPEKDVDSK
jgi:Ca-activated chloride channel homolog